MMSKTFFIKVSEFFPFIYLFSFHFFILFEYLQPKFYTFGSNTTGMFISCCGVLQMQKLRSPLLRTQS